MMRVLWQNSNLKLPLYPHRAQRMSTRKPCQNPIVLVTHELAARIEDQPSNALNFTLDFPHKVQDGVPPAKYLQIHCDSGILAVKPERGDSALPWVKHGLHGVHGLAFKFEEASDTLREVAQEER